MSKDFDDDRDNKLRRINMFLMLNTNANFMHDLQDNTKICHLINNFPQLSKCIYASLLWNVKLEKYFYETVKYCGDFVVDFLEEIIDSLRHSKPFVVIRQVQEIVEAIYEHICRIDFRLRKNDVNQEIIMDKFMKHISTALRYYNTPCADVEITKSKKKLREHLGSSFKHQISLVISCLNMFQNKPSFEINQQCQIYTEIFQNTDKEINNYSKGSHSQTVNNILSNINIVLLNTLQNSILNITLEDFMYWVEIDIDDSSIEDVDLRRNNLQKFIGEESYNLIEMINGNAEFTHDVIKQLSTIAIKPKTLAEVAKEASVGIVLEKIELSVTRIVWLEELLNRKKTLYFNTECLQTIIENAEILKLKHLLKILVDYQEFSSSMDNEDEAQIKEIFLKGGAYLSSKEIMELVQELIRTLGDDYNLSNLELQDDFINYFNKITEDNIDEKIMWKLMFKCPKKFYELLLDDVMVQDESQIQIVLKIICETRHVASNYLHDIVTHNMRITSSAASNTCRHIFLVGLFKLQIMERKEFVKDIIMHHLSLALSLDDTITILVILRVLHQISSHLKIDDLLPPLLILLAGTLEKYRWDMMTYTSVQENIIEMSSSVTPKIIKTILKYGSKNDKEWIKTRIENYKPMTKYYFQKFWLDKGEMVTSFETFLHPDDFSNEPKSKIVPFLCETIIRCSSRECMRLMRNEFLQDYFTDALIVIALIVRNSSNENSINCFQKCITDYVKILMVS